MFGFLKKKTNNNLPLNIGFETDVHAHILPGIDDGAENIEESIGLIRDLQSYGIKKIIATSHITEEVFPNNKEIISDAYSTLKMALEAEGIDIEIHFSAEYRLDALFTEQWKKGELMPFPGNYLLIENPYLQQYWKLDETIFELKVSGFNPILAHPERYTYYHSNHAAYDRIHDLGCKFQVNILSLAGVYGKEMKKAAMYLVSKGYVDFLATDVHHARHTAAIETFIRSNEYQKILSGVNVLNDTLI